MYNTNPSQHTAFRSRTTHIRWAPGESTKSAIMHTDTPGVCAQYVHYNSNSTDAVSGLITQFHIAGLPWRRGNLTMLLPNQPCYVSTFCRISRIHKPWISHLQAIKSEGYACQMCRISDSHFIQCDRVEYDTAESVRVHHTCSTLNCDACFANLNSFELSRPSWGIEYIRPHAQSENCWWWEWHQSKED